MHINSDDELVGCMVNSCSVVEGAGGNVFLIGTIIDTDTEPTLEYQNYKFIQTEELTELGVAVHPYGAFIIPSSALASNPKCVVKYGDDLYEANFAENTEVGDTPTFTKVENEGGGGEDNSD